MAQRLLNFSQYGEISPNLVTLLMSYLKQRTLTCLTCFDSVVYKIITCLVKSIPVKLETSREGSLPKGYILISLLRSKQYSRDQYYEPILAITQLPLEYDYFWYIILGTIWVYIVNLHHQDESVRIPSSKPNMSTWKLTECLIQCIKILP